MKSYDIIVIGGGGGTKLISPPAKMGLKVAAIEKEALGGTCLNRGCIPSKMLIHPADVIQEITQAHSYDISVEKPSANFSKIVDFASNSVDKTAENIAKAYEKNENIDYYHGTGKFISNKIVEVNGEQITADKIFIAVGARSKIPNIPGLKDTPFMTSREALRNTKKPKSMIVIGGGYIGVELGYFYAEMGTDVQFVVRGNKMVKREDSEVVDEFMRVFTSRYKTHLNSSTTKVSYENNEFTVTVEDPAGKTTKLKAEALLVAVGITPNTDTLNLEATDIKTTDKGFIMVDDTLQTTVPNIYSLGDCIGKYFFRHTVNFEGEYLFETLYKNPSKKPIQYPPIPHAIFSNPQIGGVGKTEDELKKEGIDYIVGLNNYKNSAMGDALRSEYGFVKLLFDKTTKKLLGAHIIGPEASNMIHMCIAFITMEATLDNMLEMIYIHPALPENVRNAVRKAKEQL